MAGAPNAAGRRDLGLIFVAGLAGEKGKFLDRTHGCRVIPRWTVGVECVIPSKVVFALGFWLWWGWGGNSTGL